jgi:hypothetical protein
MNGLFEIRIWSSFDSKEYEILKALVFLLLIFSFSSPLKAQLANCAFKQPRITFDFGSGNVRDVNTVWLSNYERVSSYCPTDGHYAYTSYTSDCFSGDWFTLSEDHTPGDVNGNMMLVNASPNSGTFLTTTLTGLKSNTTYEFGVWIMNVCKITDKCPFPLLPDIRISLQTTEGKTVARFSTGKVVRYEVPRWKLYRALFTTPPSETTLILIMTNNAPGGCGNDFALDDITLSECIKPTPTVTTAPKSNAVARKQPAAKKPVTKKTPAPVTSQTQTRQIVKPQKDSGNYATPVLKQRTLIFPPPPPVLTRRTNLLVKQIETEAGEIRIDLYDNGEIDGDTVSIYHNNALLVAHARLSQKPISFRITVDAARPHHELIMVAENLGSIPPNTSLMIVTAGNKRYQVFISSTEQKNAKLVLDLKE